MSAEFTPPDWDAIARYVCGESSDDEARAVRSWLETHPADRALAEQLTPSSMLDTTPADVDVDSALARVRARMAEGEPVAAISARSPLSVVRGRRSSTRWLAPAIALPIAAAIITVMVMRMHPAPTSAPTVAATRSYVTGVGQRDSVRLADGSRVLLGPMSRLDVPSDFGASARTVQLTGDAYFDVRHDAAKPFAVRAGQAVIQDIGTMFTVESDGGDSGTATTVSVVSGSVSLRAASEPVSGAVVLAAGDRGALDHDGRARIERHAVGADDVAWTTGRLVFNDSPLSRVIPEIQRWYGVTLVVSDSALLKRTVHTSFTGESADRALEILGLTLGAHIQRHGDTAVVSPAGVAGAR